MNKYKEYQEALDKIVKNCCPVSKKWVITLQKLVDKEKPKKLKSKTDKDGRLLWVCPNCGDVYMKFWSDVETITCRKYCDECGQKLDWGEE